MARIALVHDYLTQYGGAERVLETLHARYPDATVVTAILDRDALPPSFQRMRIVDGGLARVPIAGRNHRAFLPLYPAIFRRLGRAVADADVVLADSSAWAHHIGVGDRQALVCYCHSPARFLYGDRDYLEPARIPKVGKYALGAFCTALRAQDRRAAARVDRFLANSVNVADRVRRIYGREARVVYPPVDLSRFSGQSAPATPEDWYLVVSRLVPHKRVDLAVRACAMTGARLKVVGDGRAGAELRAMAGPNVEFLGVLDDETVADLLGRCKALLLPAAEDFGMTAVEAQAAGRPVIAYGRGGALESVIDGETGLFFREPSADALAEAMRAFEARAWDPAAARRNAARFGTEPFLRAIDEEIALALAQRRPTAA